MQLFASIAILHGYDNTAILAEKIAHVRIDLLLMTMLSPKRAQLAFYSGTEPQQNCPLSRVRPFKHCAM